MMSRMKRRRGEGGAGRDGGKEEQEEKKTMQLHMKEEEVKEILGEREEDSFDAPWLETVSIAYAGGQMYISQEKKGTAAVAAGTGENGTRVRDCNQGRRGSGATSNDTWGSWDADRTRQYQ